MTDATSRAPIWQADAPMAKEGLWLLEASAGTGKTWQLASLVARLVVEEGVAIERVLVITFTNAATAELRDRVRRRLAEVRSLLQVIVHSEVDPVDRERLDEVLRLLIDGPAGAPIDTDGRRERLRRVEAALSAFDLAPISTIHGFCQRMLETLAFESGEDTGLTLLEDTRALRDRLVADALANAYARVDDATLAQLRSLGWTADALASVVDKVGAGLPVQPATAPTAGPLEALAPHQRMLAEVRRWWADPQGGGALVEALCADGVQQRFGLHRSIYAPAKVRAHAAKVSAWLAAGAPTAQATMTSKTGTKPATFIAAFTSAGVAAKTSKSTQVAFEHPGLGRFATAVAELEGQTPNLLAGFAAHAERTLEAELRRRQELTYDTILRRLAEAVARELGTGSTPLADAVRGLYDVALVDEFQDTDTSQWTVLRHVFMGAPGKRLFLIGDPKQAIYAFRGADVFVYLAAKGHTASAARPGDPGRYTMTTNRRSDGSYVRAMNALWCASPRPFGALDMDYVVVDVPEGTPDTRLVGGPPVTPAQAGATAPGTRSRRALELRWLAGSVSPAGAARRPGNTAAARLAAASCAAAEVARLLSASVALAEGVPGIEGAVERALRPGDIAVLVNTGREGAMVKRALARVGVMAVTAGRGTVFESQAARWLIQLLDALAAPAHERRARTLAVTPLFGWTLAELDAALHAAADPAEGPATPVAGGAGGELESAAWPEQLVWERWREALLSAARQWEKRRFAGVVQRLMQDFQVLERVLTLDDGERHATDLRHLLELGHAAERQHHLSPGGLADWLRKERASQSSAEAVSLRLESDAEAVQIVTLHKSKGLQYGVVLMPFCWIAKPPKNELGPLVMHPYRDDTAAPPELRAQAVMDLHAPKSAEREGCLELATDEFLEEETRKLYVALTRAKHHCVAWFGAVAGQSSQSALNRLLYASPEAREDLEAACASAPTASSKPETREAKWAAIEAAAARLLERSGRRFSSGDIGVAVDVEPSARAQRALREQLRAARRAQASDGGAAPGELRVASMGGRTHLRSSWQRASYTSMASGRGMQSAADGASGVVARAAGGAADQRAPASPSSGPATAVQSDAEHGHVGNGDAPRATQTAEVDGLEPAGEGTRASAVLGDLQGGEDDGDAAEAPARFASVAELSRQPVVSAAERASLASTPLPLARMWGGATVGVWVHAVFEQLDFAPTDPDGLSASVMSGAAMERARGSLASLAAQVPLRALPDIKGPGTPQQALDLAAALGARHGHRRAEDHALLVAALPGILTTPLDAPEVASPWRLAPGACLAQLGARDRLDEMAFDLRVAGGELARRAVGSSVTARIDVDAVTDALALRLEREPTWDGRGWLQPLVDRARGAAQDPAYVEQLRAWRARPVATRGSRPRPWSILPRIRGILTGLIDLVFRTPADVPGGFCYYLADYKSNRLTNSGDRTTTQAHYERPWLAWSMGHSAYHLQGLVYTVALHRFLAGRIPDYDYDLHLGGHLYLYLRGMEGPQGRASPDRSARGVYHDRWPREVVLGMNAALEGAFDPEDLS